MDYSDYRIEDFIMDESFHSFCVGTSEEAKSFWTIWITNNPSKKKEVNAAKKICLILNGNTSLENFTVDEIKFHALLRSRGILNSQNATEVFRPVWSVGLKRVNQIWKVAAVFILIISVAAIVYNINEKNARTEFATAYGKTDTLALPDNSVIIANANSIIKYNKYWNSDEPREIWLEGEAFFNVRLIKKGERITPHDRFIVHVKHASIEVIGTSFNVRERRDKTQIVLQSGRIKVSFENNSRPDIIMQPGQIITIDSLQQVHSSIVNPESYTSWKNKKLLLTNASLKEIVEYLEDFYGKRIILSDPQSGNRKMEGIFRLDNLDDALLIISKALNLKIVEQDNTLFITAN